MLEINIILNENNLTPQTNTFPANLTINTMIHKNKTKHEYFIVASAHYTSDQGPTMTTIPNNPSCLCCNLILLVLKYLPISNTILDLLR